LRRVTPLTRDVFDSLTASGGCCDYFAVATMEASPCRGWRRPPRRGRDYIDRPSWATAAAVAAFGEAAWQPPCIDHATRQCSN